MEISLNQLRETYERYINLEQFLILGQEELTVEMETLCNIWEGEAKEAFRVSMQNFLTTGRYALLLEKTKEIQEILKKGIDGISEEMNRSDCFNQLVSGEMQGIGYYDSQRERGGYFISRDSGYFLPKCDELQNTTQEQKNYLRQIRQKISYQISPYHPLISKMEECERNTRELENVEEFKRSLQIYINEGAEIDDGLSKEFERLFGETYSIHEKQYAALGSYLTEENGKEKVEIEILEKYVSGEISVAQAYEMLTMLRIEAKEMIQEREELIANVGKFSSVDARNIKKVYLEKLLAERLKKQALNQMIMKLGEERNGMGVYVSYLLSGGENVETTMKMLSYAVAHTPQKLEQLYATNRYSSLDAQHIYESLKIDYEESIIIEVTGESNGISNAELIELRRESGSEYEIAHIQSLLEAYQNGELSYEQLQREMMLHELVSVAYSQAGIVEKCENDVYYNNWYYNNMTKKEPWCSAFMLWCANEAGMVGTTFPEIREIRERTFEGVRNVRLYYEEKKWYHELFSEVENEMTTNQYIPKVGDLFISRSWSTKSGDWQRHIGIVAGYNEETNTIYTIEGNSGDKVAMNARAAVCNEAGSGVIGYCQNGGMYSDSFYSVSEFSDNVSENTR